MLSDERTENRLKAVYLLGQLGFYLGVVREHDHLLLLAFKSLIKKLLEVQYHEKFNAHLPPSQRFTQGNRALKVYLLHAIGKFTRFVHGQSRYMEDLVIYALHEEFAQGDVKVEVEEGKEKKKKGKRDKADTNGALCVVRALLGVLNNEVGIAFC